MATYAIGDVQGCFLQLKELLALIEYDPSKDTLWFTGDLVNRGSHSLETLRFISALPPTTICVLGNHDLALLAAAEGAIKPQPGDTYDDILKADDKDELLQWLRYRPLLHHDSQLNFTLTHAGIYPLWTLSKAAGLAKEVEHLLQSPQYHEAMQVMFGDRPSVWSDSLVGWERFRFIVNAFTRMRFKTRYIYIWALGRIAGPDRCFRGVCAGYRLCVGECPHSDVLGNRAKISGSLPPNELIKELKKLLNM